MFHWLVKTPHFPPIFSLWPPGISCVSKDVFVRFSASKPLVHPALRVQLRDFHHWGAMSHRRKRNKSKEKGKGKTNYPAVSDK